MRLVAFLIIVAVLITSCIPLENKTFNKPTTDLKNQEIAKILDFQDRQHKDSLLLYFDDPNPNLRYHAVYAFGSYKEEAVTDDLVEKLNDDEILVRQAAAYALGQIGSAKAELPLTTAFISKDSSSSVRLLNATILEALGKCGRSKTLDLISSVKTYNPSDTLLIASQMRSLFYFGRRGMVDSIGTKRVVDVVSDFRYTKDARLYAAHYLQRFSNLGLQFYESQILNTIEAENDPEILMALSTAAGKLSSPAARTKTIGLLQNSSDPRVIINTIRALKNFDYFQVRDAIIPFLKNENLQVANAAGQFFIDGGLSTDATFYYRTAQRDTSVHWQVKAKLLSAANRHMSNLSQQLKGELNYWIGRYYDESTNMYEKAALYDAMAEFPWNYKNIYDKVSKTTNPILKTAAYGALSKILQNPNFDRFFGLSRNRVKRDIAFIYSQALKDRDIGTLSGIGSALGAPESNMVGTFTDTTALLNAMDSLVLPRDFEILQILNAAATRLGFESRKVDKPNFNNPIDWQFLSTLPDTLISNIETVKGSIQIELFTEEAPGSVINFVKLAESNFYDQKNFHRVVPNFVAQGGCTRGDGYGILDFTIRSELPKMYYNRGGLLGMASSGNHTEGTQFFITHSPTPHLDGNYTIFGKVIAGIDVLDRINVGDKITNISIFK